MRVLNEKEVQIYVVEMGARERGDILEITKLVNPSIRHSRANWNSTHRVF